MQTELEQRHVKRLSNKEANRITRECICSALIRLMEKTPYEKITMTMIIQRSGVSRGSIYRNYASKDDIMKDITREITDGLCDSLSGVIGEKESARKWLVGMFSELKTSRELCVLLEKANLPLLEIFEEILKRSSVPVDSPKRRYQVRAATSALITVTKDWIRCGMEEKPEEMADICCELLNLEEM